MCCYEIRKATTILAAVKLKSILMKTPTPLACISLFLFALCLLFIVGCKKGDELYTGSFSIYVTKTSPERTNQGCAYDDVITASLNRYADTSRFLVTLGLVKGDTVVQGTVNEEDTLVTFNPAKELTPSSTYTATLTITEKGASSRSYRYEWNFTTKEADQYKMTLRSTQVTDGNRDGSRSMQIGNYCYSLGGWKNPPEDSYSDVYRSSGDLSTWEKRPDAPWHGRHVFGVAKLADSVYVIGGDNLHSEFDVWRTVDGEHWTLLSENVLGNRIYPGCTVHKGYIYVVGGLWYNDVWRSRDGKTWEKVADNISFLNGMCFTGSLASFNGKLWMVCGGNDGYGTSGPIRKEVWSSVDGKEWKREDDFAGSKRYYTDVCVWDNKLWVVGGYNFEEGNIRSIWYMKPNGNWQEFQVPADYVGRHATAVTVYNNQLVITCGNYQNNCWVIEKVK